MGYELRAMSYEETISEQFLGGKEVIQKRVKLGRHKAARAAEKTEYGNNFLAAAHDIAASVSSVDGTRSLCQKNWRPFPAITSVISVPQLACRRFAKPLAKVNHKEES